MESVRPGLGVLPARLAAALGVGVGGAFAEFVLEPLSSLVKLRTNLLERGGVGGLSLATRARAVIRRREALARPEAPCP